MAGTWQIAIVGGGPVGIFAANLLAQAGHSVCVIERDQSPYSLPRAVHVDHEMIRLFTEIGIAEALGPLLRAGDGHIHIGSDQGVIRFLSAAGQPRPFGHANDYFFYQPELEEILRRQLAAHRNARLELGANVVGLTQTADGVRLTLEDGRQISADWVIGCDGARSTLRKLLGITLDDLEFEEPWLVVDAEVDGPILFPDYAGVPEGANLQNLSLMQCDPARPATIVPGRGNHRRWEFMLLPHEEDEAMARPENVAAMVAPWVGETPHRIIRAATYRFHGLVAEYWQQGRMLLAGDAAHQTPPFFGQGLCHGLRDAANLAWKLDLVLRGLADATLLATYQTEREAQVRHVIGKAVEAGRYICELDPQKAAERDRAIRGQTGMKTAGELIAPIASAIVGQGGGERFINPTTGAGLLDDTLGYGWRLISAQGSPEHPALERLAATCTNLSTLPDPEGHLADWFQQRGVRHALIRPDHYVALAVSDYDALTTGLNALADAAGLRLPQTV